MLTKFDKLLNIFGIFKIEYYENNNNNCLIFCNKYVKLRIKYLYTLFVFIILSLKSCFLLNYAINENKNYVYSIILFSLVSPLNYILGFIYICHNHFHKVFLDIILNKYKIDYCISKEKNLIISILTTSLLFIIFNLITIFTGTDESQNYYIDNDNTILKIFYIIYIVIYTIYSRIIISMNMHIFYFVFCKHLKDIKYQTNELDEVESWTNSQTKVAELCHNLIELRYELSVSISKLGRIYIWLTILGSFGIGLAIHFKKYDTTIISNIFIYIILQLIFLSIISIVGKNRQKLCDIIHTPGFSMKYILRDNNASETIENMITLENDTIITIKEIMSNKNIKIINCDNEIDNNEIKYNDIELYETDMKETKKNSNIIKKMYNNVEQSGSSIDWLILNNILNNKWTHIDLFGISFDDGSGISKSIALTTTIIAMLNYIFNLFI